jgi:hypothetical protein
MYIKREINIVITDEEKEILEKARDILMTFEDECSSADDIAIQEMYEEYTDCVEHQDALPTAIDLLTTILKGNKGE